MVSIKSFRELALSYPETTEEPHFERTSFRVKKKIFATLGEQDKKACLMLAPIDQPSFCAAAPAVIYPVPNKWGLQGATYVELNGVDVEVLEDALTMAYCKVAPKKLAQPYIDRRNDVV
jgi:hypothetical protein